MQNQTLIEGKKWTDYCYRSMLGLERAPQLNSHLDTPQPLGDFHIGLLGYHPGEKSEKFTERIEQGKRAQTSNLRLQWVHIHVLGMLMQD